jgi:HAD superfamily hydrolase (TIGR01509 family)
MTREGLGAVLWDMDGTLIDSQPAWIRAQSRLVAEHGGQWTHSDGLTLVGVSMDEVARSMQSAGVVLSDHDILARLTRDVTASLESQAPWLPGAYELVQSLFEAGIPQAIVTSAPQFVARFVAAALAEGAIHVVVADEHVSKSKPDPEPYLAAAQALGVSPDHCLAIEDSPAGLAAAIAAGVTTLGVPRHMELDMPGPWVRVETLRGLTPDDLVAILTRRSEPIGPNQ